MHQNTETFLELFNQLETSFKQRLSKDKFTSFSSLVREGSSKDSFIRVHRSLLESFSDLRNVLVHKEGNEIIAVPTDEAVQKLREVVEIYTAVKTVYDVSNQQVIITSKNKSLLKVLNLIRHHNYTKIPVYDGVKFVGLLSGNVLTRWFTGHITEQGQLVGNLNGVTVGDVIEGDRKNGEVQFVPKNMDVFEFIAYTQKHPSKSGVTIITENGRSDEKAIGILTAYDYGKLLKGLEN